jgi:uncharacterized tellurite resistance protein B-like protein
MADKDRVCYLANIILISKADGKFDSHEKKAIDRICETIGARVDDVNRAIKAVDGGYQLTPVGRFSDKVRNLEDMVFIALSDGQLPEAEKMKIRSFAKAINVSQHQINEIISESKDRLQPENMPLTCPACKVNIQRDSTFCAYCGVRI